MSFPFGRDVSALRQRLLCAIGGGGLIGLALAGCNSVDDNEPKGTPTSSGGTTGGGSSGSSGSASGGAGSSSRAGSGSVAGSGSMTLDAGMMMSKPDASTTIRCEAGFMVTEMCWTRSEMESKAMLGCGQIAPDPQPTAAEVQGMFLANGCLPKAMACDGCCNPGVSDGTPKSDGSCCYAYCPGACCGRPFEVDGETRTAGVNERSDWGAFPPVAPSAEASALAPELVRRIAREWLDDARMEHASIASFARFTLELLSVGAPASLLADAQQAALDEVAHAELCFALASRYAGCTYGPDALRTEDCRPAAELHDVLLAAFKEGCIGETLAAAHARAALASARDPEVHAALSRIADDEARHAELAWRFVAWGLPHSDQVTRSALRDALAAALEQQPAPASEHEAEATIDALHCAGRITTSEALDLARRTLREVVVPCAEVLLSQAS